MKIEGNLENNGIIIISFISDLITIYLFIIVICIYVPYIRKLNNEIGIHNHGWPISAIENFTEIFGIANDVLNSNFWG